MILQGDLCTYIIFFTQITRQKLFLVFSLHWHQSQNCFMLQYQQSIELGPHLWLKIQKTNNIFLNLIFYFSCSKSYSSTENEIQRSTTTKFMSWRPNTLKTNVLTLWFSHISYVKCCRKLPKFQCGRKLYLWRRRQTLNFHEFRTQICQVWAVKESQ